MKKIPNILSFFRFFASIGVLLGILLINPDTDKLLFILVPGLIFLIGSLTDIFDGKIARKYNAVTDFGKFIDPIADKMLTFFAMLGFIVIDADNGLPVMLVCMAVTLFREFLVSSVRMISASRGTVIAANIYGKIKTCLQMTALTMYFVLIRTPYLWTAQIILCLAIIMTVVSGAIYTADFFKSNKSK